MYDASSVLGVITDLSQVYLAMYDTSLSPFTCTGSENIDITDNNISLNLPMKINDEVVLQPRIYGDAVFEMISGTDNFAFRQNVIHGGTPIAQC